MIASYDDGDVSRFGPGAAHLRDLLSHALARGCRRFDFTIGDERYKLEWSDHTLNLYDHVAPATWRGWPLAELMLAAPPRQAHDQAEPVAVVDVQLAAFHARRQAQRGSAACERRQVAIDRAGIEHPTAGCPWRAA